MFFFLYFWFLFVSALVIILVMRYIIQLIIMIFILNSLWAKSVRIKQQSITPSSQRSVEHKYKYAWFARKALNDDDAQLQYLQQQKSSRMKYLLDDLFNQI